MLRKEDFPLQEIGKCFENRNDSMFLNMMNLLARCGSTRLTLETIDKCRFIPLELLKRNGIEMGPLRNVVWLSPENALRQQVLLCHYFHRTGDLDMKDRTLQRLRRMEKDAYCQMTNYGDISMKVYEEYSRRRYQEFRKM